jgi:hypothetical protein
MKTLNFKSLIIAGSIILISGLTTNNVLAQRSSRGGGSGGGSHVSAGGGSRPSRPSQGAISGSNRPSRPSQGNISGGTRPSRPSIGNGSRPDYRPSRPGNRPGYGYRPGAGYRPGYHYRPGYSYRRPYYGYYHNYYRPFLGISLSVLPYGYYPFYFGADQFYYSGGFFYRQYDEGYKVVVPPVGAQVPSIPSEAKEITINGQTYYEYKGVYYSTTVDADGKTVYVVAGKDGVLDTGNGTVNDDTSNLPQVGDVIDQLPDGTRDVMIKGSQYYVSEEGVYYEKIVDGNNITYKVIGIGN